MTRDALIALLERKLTRRKFLCRQDVRMQRGNFSPPSQSVALTFKEVEALLDWMREDRAAALERKLKD